jgi:hypothetical protein
MPLTLGLLLLFKSFLGRITHLHDGRIMTSIHLNEVKSRIIGQSKRDVSINHPSALTVIAYEHNPARGDVPIDLPTIISVLTQ